MSGVSTGDVRQRLIVAATEVIATGRHASMPLRAVAERAGTTTGAIQHHFRNREGLMLAVLGRHGERIVERLESRRVGTTPPPPAVARAILLEFLPLDEERREESLVALAFEGLAAGAAAEGDGELARAYSQQHAMLAGLLAEHLPRSAPNDVDVILASISGIRTDMLLRRVTDMQALGLIEHLLGRFS